MKPNRVANLGLWNKRCCKHIKNLVSSVLIISLVPNFIHQHDVTGIKLDMLQLIYILPWQFDVERIKFIIFIIRVLVSLIELIVVCEVRSIVSDPSSDLVRKTSPYSFIVVKSSNLNRIVCPICTQLVCIKLLEIIGNILDTNIPWSIQDSLCQIVIERSVFPYVEHKISKIDFFNSRRC